MLRDAVVAQAELRRVLRELDAAKTMLPICSWCNKVRVENGPGTVPLRQSLHEFVAEATSVTHSICPDCARRLSGPPV